MNLRYFAIVGAFGFSFFSTNAHGQTPEELAKLQKALNDAIEACDKGAYEVALPLFKRVTADRKNMGAGIAYAQCLEAKKDWLGAIKICNSVIEAARIEINSGVDPLLATTAEERLKKATQLRDNLKARLPKLHLIVSGDDDRLEDLRVELNGRPLDPVQWNRPLEVNPGTHQITSRISEGPLQPMEVRVMPMTGLGITYPALLALPPNPKKTEIEAKTALKSFGIGSIALGAAGVVTGAVFLKRMMDQTTASEIGGHCPPDPIVSAAACDDTGYPIRRDAERHGTAATWLFITGGVFLGLGGALTIAGYKLGNANPGTSGKVTFVLMPWGAGLTGRF
jgi:hypothetical protein